MVVAAFFIPLYPGLPYHFCMSGIFLLRRVNKDLKVKVADFGFSRDIYSKDYYRLERKTRLPVKWLPPECLLDNKYDVKTDVVSYTVHCCRGGVLSHY